MTNCVPCTPTHTRTRRVARHISHISAPTRHMTHVARGVACPVTVKDVTYVTHVSLAGLTRSLMHSVTYSCNGRMETHNSPSTLITIDEYSQ